jgi:hypothetical protein
MACNKVFRDCMETNRFKQSAADPCVYVRSSDKMAIVAIYVDDLIFTTQTLDEMHELKNSLSTRFKMKDMSKLHYCLGISIKQDESQKCLWMHQRQYVEKLLEKYGLSLAKNVSTPVNASVKIAKCDGVSKDLDRTKCRYQSMVGSLLHAAMATRPDISYAVGVVSKFSEKPSEAHFTAVKRIFQYLKGTVDLALKYQKLQMEH